MELFGPALEAFLDQRGMGESEASRKMDFERATLNTYTHGLANGARRRAPAELLAKACVRLGFRFDFEGHTIVALRNGKQKPTDGRQLRLEFELEKKDHTLLYSRKKPPQTIQLSVSIKTTSR